MLAPPVPDSEVRRLRALRDLEILDTPPEERFDRLTRIAQQVFEVPIALVSLVDTNRQWFKSCQGLDASETPRNISFCGHAILQAGIFHIPDASADERFRDNPLVAGAPFIRFYAGAPLTMSNGERAGTLCIIDTRPRELDARQLQLLRELADCVQEEFKLLRFRESSNLIREQEQRLRALIDHMLDGVVTIDEAGYVENFNPAAEAIFGYAAREVVGHNVSMLMPEPYRSAHDVYLQHYRDSGVGRIIGTVREVQGQRKDGSVFPMELAVSRMDAPGSPRFLGVVRDISRLKEVERMKDEFVSSVSHELRTPVTSIRGALGLIAGGQAGEIPEQARSLVAIAHDNSERLVRLVNDILDMQKMDLGRITMEIARQEVLPVLEEAVGSMQGYASEFGVDVALVRTVPGVRARVDAGRLQQVMSNLLSNAVKFSPRDSRVEVSMERQGQLLRIEVRDHGEGIPYAAQAGIFGKFYQVTDNGPRRQGGTGLGLYISRGIVERFGGQIGFASTPGEGSRFYVELPVS